MALPEYQQTVSYTHTVEYYWTILKGLNSDTLNKLDKSPGNYPEWKKSNPKTCILYNSTYVIFWKDKTIGHG